MFSSSAEALRAKKLGDTVVKALESRHFEPYYCDDREQAKALVMSLIPEGASVSFGGSATIDQIGIIPSLKEGNFRVIDRNSVPAEERERVMRDAFFADYYLSSSNAVTEDGMLFNIDGNGNRVAAMTYGPKNVIVVVGINKIVKDIDAAVSRARNLAAPTNAQRFEISTPCKISGSCADCKSKDSICAYMVTTILCRPAKKIKVIIVGESLGF